MNQDLHEALGIGQPVRNASLDTHSVGVQRAGWTIMEHAAHLEEGNAASASRQAQPPGEPSRLVGKEAPRSHPAFRLVNGLVAAEQATDAGSTASRCAWGLPPRGPASSQGLIGNADWSCSAWARPISTAERTITTNGPGFTWRAQRTFTVTPAPARPTDAPGRATSSPTALSPASLLGALNGWVGGNG